MGAPRARWGQDPTQGKALAHIPNDGGKWLSGAVVGVLVGAASVCGTAAPAQAYTKENCRSSAISGNGTDYYRTGNGITSYYSTTITTAAGKWNSTSSPGSLAKVTSGGQIVIERYYYSYQWYALSSWTCSSSGYFTGNRGMALNSRTMDPFASWQDRFVIIHEFGHLMGLGHENGLAACKAVMKSDAHTGTSSCSSTNPPYTNDVDGMNAIY